MAEGRAEPERRRGAYGLLSRPSLYTALQRLLGSRKGFERLVGEHIRPRSGDSVLDIGCGPGELLSYLGDVRYTGLDVNPRYIEAARRSYGDRGKFICADAEGADLPSRSFDRVVVSGVVHHLDESAARSLFSAAAAALIPDGRLVVLEPTWEEGQSRTSRWVMGRDRGANIRSVEEYEALAGANFERVTTTTRSDLVRIPYTHVILPYTHVILECSEPRRR